MFNKYMNPRYFGYGQYALLSLPIALYFAVVYRYSVNIPTLDDYAAVLDFLRYFREARGIDKFFVLFTQHGEHRILSSRIAYVLSDMLPGEINFRTLIFLGNLQLLLTLLIVIYFIRKSFSQHWLILSFVASLFLFDLSNWENAHFAMASVQNYGILFLFSASLFFYSLRSGWFTGLAFIAQVVCIFSSGNGTIAALFVTLFCILERSKIKIALSLLATLVCAPLYFVNYNASVGGHASRDYGNVTLYFFRLVSGHIHCPDVMLKVLLGIVLMVLSIIVFPMGKHFKINRENAFFASMFGFIVVTIALTSVYRSSLSDIPPSRYLVYPHYLALVIVLFAVRKMRSDRVQTFLTAIAILGALNYIPNFEYGLKDFRSITEKIKTTDYDYPDRNVARAIAERCCKDGIYCIDPHRDGR